MLGVPFWVDVAVPLTVLLLTVAAYTSATAGNRHAAAEYMAEEMRKKNI